MDPDESLVDDGSHELFPLYRAMAIVNGVSADDPALAACRVWQAAVPPEKIEPTLDQEQA